MGQVPVKQRLDKAQVRSLQRLVSFSEQEIRDWHKEFRLRINRRSHAHDEFYLTEEEFVKVYNSVYPGKCDEFARHVFRTFDVDRNRRVDFREFLMGLSKSGSSDLHKQLLWAFELYDVNRTGFITKDNMTQIIRAVFKMISHPSLYQDNTTETPESLADDLFRQLDKDGDQLISWPEFSDGAVRNPTVLRLLQCGPPDSASPVCTREERYVFS